MIVIRGADGVDSLLCVQSSKGKIPTVAEEVLEPQDKGNGRAGSGESRGNSVSGSEGERDGTGETERLQARGLLSSGSVQAVGVLGVNSRIVCAVTDIDVSAEDVIDTWEELNGTRGSRVVTECVACPVGSWVKIKDVGSVDIVWSLAKCVAATCSWLEDVRICVSRVVVDSVPASWAINVAEASLESVATAVSSKVVATVSSEAVAIAVSSEDVAIVVSSKVMATVVSSEAVGTVGSLCKGTDSTGSRL